MMSDAHVIPLFVECRSLSMNDPLANKETSNSETATQTATSPAEPNNGMLNSYILYTFCVYVDICITCSMYAIHVVHKYMHKRTHIYIYVHT